MRITRSAIVGHCARAIGALVVVGGVAVGAALSAPPPVAAATTGPTWSGTTAPLPSNADPTPEASAGATSCPAPGACVTAGNYSSGGNNVLFAATLTNGTWTSVQVPSPPGDNGTDAYVQSISCPTVGSCVLTGGYENTSNARLAFASQLSGGTWSTVALPLPPADSDPDVTLTAFDLSCPAVGWCVQGGDFEDSSNNNQGFIDTLSGGSWTSIVAPLPPNPPSDPEVDVFGVSCGSVGSCVVAGPYHPLDQENFFDLLNAGTWTSVLGPVPGNAKPEHETEVFDVSCPPQSTNCVGAGDYNDTNGQSQNEAWTISITTGAIATVEVAPPSDVAASPGASLNAVSCPVAGWCEAVGGYNSTTFPQGTMEAATFSGGSWSTQAPPGMIAGYKFGELGYVTCSWPGSCVGSGTLQQASGNDQVLINTLTNGVWTGNDAVLPNGADPTKYANVGLPTCAAGYCVVSGYYNDFGQGLIETHPNLTGYQEVASDGGLFSFNAPFYGSMGGKPLNAPIVGMAVEPDNGAYYEVASDGGIFAFNAPFQGSMGGKPLNKPIVGMAFDTQTGGYYEVASDGGIFAFNAPFYGSMGGKALNKPIVGMAFDGQTGGYYEVASDGGIFAFNAPFAGSMGGKPLNEPIVGLTVNTATGGYYEVASDGGLFAFNAPFAGSMGGKPLNKPIVGMAYNYASGGYYEVASDGGIFAFNAPFQGSMGGQPLNKPVVAIAAG